MTETTRLYQTLLSLIDFMLTLYFILSQRNIPTHERAQAERLWTRRFKAYG